MALTEEQKKEWRKHVLTMGGKTPIIGIKISDTYLAYLDEMGRKTDDEIVEILKQVKDDKIAKLEADKAAIDAELITLKT